VNNGLGHRDREGRRTRRSGKTQQLLQKTCTGTEGIQGLQCRRRILGTADTMPRVASMAASVASRVCGTWHMAALRASVDRQSHTSASIRILVEVSGAPLCRMDMFLTTPQLVATLYFLCPVRPAASILYFPAPHDTLYFPTLYNQR